MTYLPITLPRTARRFAVAGFCSLMTLLFWLATPLLTGAQTIPANTKWITALGAPEHAAGILSFRRIILLDALPESYPVHVSADNRFILYVNGQRVGEGPARGDRTHWRFETFDLKPFLHKGRMLSPPACGTSAISLQ
jgi:hypothetical protein